MKELSFTKMAGAGNDFIIIEALKNIPVKKLAVKVCDRTEGIGADGLILLDKSTKADYKMRIINADGSEAEMCGNGARCLASYIKKNKKPKKKLFSIETKAGLILAEAQEEMAHIRLNEPKDYRESLTIKVGKRKLNLSYINTGVPHTVIFVDQLKDINVDLIGRLIRIHQEFQPRGTNVNFVEQVRPNLVASRTYERGVEAETKACGTGSVASAIVAFMKSHGGITNKNKAGMKVKTKSGEILLVTFDIKQSRPTNVWLKGSAKFIAQGQYFFK